MDLDTGAIVAITTQGGAVDDRKSIEETLPEAGLAVAGQIDTPADHGRNKARYKVHAQGLCDVVTDKGYHSEASLTRMMEWGVKTYIPAPKKNGKTEPSAVVKANQRRVESDRGKALLRKRGELLERPFAHQYETGAMRRLYVRGRDNVAKRVLLQAAAFNLALILRSITRAGTPRGLADLTPPLLSALLHFLDALPDTGGPASVTASFRHFHSERCACVQATHPSVENRGSDTGC